jgi:histidinol-phosphatase
VRDSGPDLDFAFRLADVADSVTRRHVGIPVMAETKPDGSPATAVDVGVEHALLAEVARLRARDGFLGEEVGARRSGEWSWIVDGIDGTAAFLLGRSEWATPIGYVHEDDPAVGVATAPALEKRWWATAGGGAWAGPLRGWASPSRANSGSHAAARAGHDPAKRIAVSQRTRSSTALVEAWISPYRATPERLAAKARLADRFRSGGDLPWATPRPADQRPSWNSGHPGGALLVAAGLLDGFVMFAGGPWDHAATALIVEEAGGRFSDADGRHRIGADTAVFSNGRFHDEILAALATDQIRSSPCAEWNRSAHREATVLRAPQSQPQT